MAKNRSFGDRGTGYTPVIQKYNLYLCRRCFREVAISLGFNKTK